MPNEGKQMKNHVLAGKTLLRVAIFLALMPLLTSCGNRIIVHPITGKDIYDGKAAGDVCFSKMYIDEVMQVKIDRAK